MVNARANDEQVGLLLKKAQSLLRLHMERALEPLGLTVSHYACLHQLRREPGISAAALARAVFVTRQSMGVLLQQLLDRELVERPDRAQNGRALPAALTPAGERVLESAEALVDRIEQQMLSGLDTQERKALARQLAACVAALEDG